jgi:hypothetical protein
MRLWTTVDNVGQSLMGPWTTVDNIGAVINEYGQLWTTWGWLLMRLWTTVDNMGWSLMKLMDNCDGQYGVVINGTMDNYGQYGAAINELVDMLWT